MKILSKYLSICSVFIIFLSANSSATYLRLEPQLLVAETGDSIHVDLIIGDVSPESIGAFDVDILYDISNLLFTSYTLSNFLGDPLIDVIDLSLGDLGGIIDLSVISLLPTGDLNSIQSNIFKLATLNFLVSNLPPATSTSIEVILADPFLYVADGNGYDVVIDESFSAVVKNIPHTDVAEPESLYLLIIGLIFIRARRYLKSIN